MFFWRSTLPGRIFAISLAAVIMLALTACTLKGAAPATYEDESALKDARHRAIAAALADRSIQPTDADRPSSPESLISVYIFPRGRADRYARLHRDTVRYFEVLEGGKKTLRWQGRLAVYREPRAVGDGDPLMAFIRSQGRIEEEWGSRPAFASSPVFFEVHPSVGTVRFGVINAEGRKVYRGGADAANLADVDFVMPGELEEG